MLLGPAPGVLGTAAAHLPMDLEASLQPCLFPQPEGCEGFQVLRVENKADGLFNEVCIVQKLW